MESEERDRSARAVEETCHAIARAQAEIETASRALGIAISKMIALDVTPLAIKLASKRPISGATLAAMAVCEALNAVAPAIVLAIETGPHSSGGAVPAFKFDPSNNVITPTSQRHGIAENPAWTSQLGGLPEMIASERARAQTLRSGEQPIAAAKPTTGPVLEADQQEVA
jgi:hypothetical protein